MTDHKNIHEAMLAIMAEEAVTYIQKERAQGVQYTVKSESAVLSAVRPAMLKHGVYVYCEAGGQILRSSYTVEKKNRQGELYTQHWVNTVIERTFRFVHAASGTDIPVTALGEDLSMTGSSAIAAMTISKKYAILEALSVITGDDPDMKPVDGNHQTGQQQQQPQGQQQQQAAPKKAEHNWTADQIFTVTQNSPIKDDGSAVAWLDRSGFKRADFTTAKIKKLLNAYFNVMDSSKHPDEVMAAAIEALKPKA